MDLQTRKRIIWEAISWKGTPYHLGGNSRRGIDCSRFVWRVYNKIVDKGIWETFFTSPDNDHLFFNRIGSEWVKKGDLICWSRGIGHIGIVVEPDAGTFIGAQTSTGVAGTYYKQGYWQGNDYYFLQYNKR